MRNSEYWKQRFSQLEEAQNNFSKITVSEIENLYRQTQKQIESKIAVWYQRLADNNEITLAEARQFLKTSDLKEFRWDVEEYIKYGKENALNQQWVKQLENASAKVHISKLEAIKIHTRQSLEELFQKQYVTRLSTYQNTCSDSYYHTAYELQKGFNIGWDIAGLNQSQIEKIISKPWSADGYNFSERIWYNKNKLINEVHTVLTQSMLTGFNPQKAIDTLAKKMNTSKTNAGRLIMTESAFFSSLSEKECYNNLGVEKYEILVTLDSRTSEICQNLDGKVFDMKDFQPGVTAPPFHVNCRSTTVPYFDEDFGNIGERAARDKDGKTYYVPADMTYSEWKKSFVDGGDKVGLAVYSDGIGVHYKKHVEPVPKNNFIPANSIEEAQEFAKRYCNDGFMAKTFKGKIDYKGISLDNANAINKALWETFETIDLEKISGIKAVSPMSAIGKKAFKDGDYAVMAYSPVEHGIFINKNILKNESAFAEYLKKSQEAWDIVINNIDKLSDKSKETALIYKNAGRSLVDGTTVEGMLKHELGHHVQWTLLDVKTNNLVGSRMSQFSPKISGYANSSKSEYLAESFSAYLKGEYDILDPEYVRFIDSKLLDKSVGSGIIKESSKKSIMPITDNSIEKVPKVKIKGYSDEQCEAIQNQHKELLKYSRDNNENKEVAFVFDNELKNRKEFKGSDDRLDFGGALYGKDLFVMHNHPRNSSYSDYDIQFFTTNDNVKSLSIIKNNGNVEIISKTASFTLKEMKTVYKRAFKKYVKQGTNEEIDKAIEYMLKKNGGILEWIK